MKNINPVKAAICSFGMSGRLFHAPFLEVSPRFSLTGVLERSKDEARKTYPAVKVYRSIEELLADDEVELVVVNTPNATHYPYVEKALLAGKHVVVEKPFTIRLAEAIRLNTLASNQGKVLTVYHNRRYDSDFKTIRRVLNSRVLGDVVEAEMRFDRFRLEPGKKLHKEIPGPGTGNLYDLGSHLLDQAIQLFGMPREIFADIGIIAGQGQVDNYFELILFYGSLRVRVHSTYVALKQMPGYVLYGTEGTFVKEKTNHQEEMLNEGKLPDTPDWGKEPTSEQGMLTTIQHGKIVNRTIESETGTYMDFYDQLYEAIRNGGPVPVTPVDAAKVIHLIELAYQSHEQKRIIPVNDIV